MLKSKLLIRAATAGTLAVLFAGPAPAFTAYVTNEKDNTLSVIDTDKQEVLKTVIGRLHFS